MGFRFGSAGSAALYSILDAKIPDLPKNGSRERVETVPGRYLLKGQCISISVLVNNIRVRVVTLFSLEVPEMCR
jgi:hypothetical protein